MTGEQLKLNGISKVRTRNAEWVEWWVGEIARLPVGDVLCSDLLQETYPWNQPPPSNPNAWGALLSTAARRGIIRRVGYRPSTRPEARGRIVSVWERV